MSRALGLYFFIMETLEERMRGCIAYKGLYWYTIAQDCATVADDHAMAFAEWCILHRDDYPKNDVASLMFHYNRSLDNE